MDNKTIFYSGAFEKRLNEVSGIISLNMGDNFLDIDGSVYEIVFKLYNPVLNLIIYHGRLNSKLY